MTQPADYSELKNRVRSLERQIRLLTRYVEALLLHERSKAHPLSRKPYDEIRDILDEE